MGLEKRGQIKKNVRARQKKEDISRQICRYIHKQILK